MQRSAPRKSKPESVEHAKAHGGEPSSPISASAYALTGLGARLYDLHNSVFGVPLINRKHVSLIKLRPGDSLLDIGCGTGEAIRQLHRSFGDEVRLVGVDPSPDMLAVAKRKLSQASTVFLELGAGEELSHPPSSFQWVISCLTMHHLPLDNKERAMLEFHRVLKPKGRILITDFGEPSNSLGRILGRIWRGHSFVEDTIHHPLHRMISEVGFADVATSIQGGLIHHTIATKPA